MWYINIPRPQVDGLSYTLSNEELQFYKKKGMELWNQNSMDIIEYTAKPFVNLIVDRDPINKFVYGNIVLLGDVAHSARPHRGQATSMSIKDAFLFEKFLRKTNQIQIILKDLRSLIPSE